MRTLFVAAAIAIFSVSSFAHEGSHGPEHKTAPHGGILREGGEFMFELVHDAGKFKVFPLDHDGKAVKPSVVTVDAKASKLVDPKKKSVPVKFEATGDAFEIVFQETGAHRYSLTLVAKYKGKEGKFNWQLEPKAE